MTFSRIPLIKTDLPPLEAVEAQFREILANGRVTNFGPYVQRFEEAAGQYLNSTVATISSATAGLVMTLQALGVKKGSRVAMPSFSFMATGQAAMYAGGTPVFVDVAADGNVDPVDLEAVLSTTDVDAIVLVHMYGLPCRPDVIDAVVKRAEARHGHRIPVVYDAAHAFGSSRDGVRAGGWGDAEVFSTSVTKVMTTVEGGVVSSRNPDLIARLKKMRNYGIDSNYNTAYPGLNGKMSEFHAIVGLYNLARLDQLLAARGERAALYIREIQSRTPFRVMAAPAGVVHTYKDFTIELARELAPRRPEFMQKLSDLGVETRAYFYPPMHEQTFFQPFATRALPMTEALSRRVLTLPFYTTITEDEMRRVTDALVEAAAAVGAVREGARA